MVSVSPGPDLLPDHFNESNSDKVTDSGPHTSLEQVQTHHTDKYNCLYFQSIHSNNNNVVSHVCTGDQQHHFNS